MFNYHLAKMRKTGILTKIELKWLSPPRPQPPEDPNQVSGALGGKQLFFPFSILLVGVACSVTLAALEKIKLLSKNIMRRR